MGSIAARFRKTTIPHPESRGLRQVLQRPGHQRDLKQRGVVEAGLRAVSHKTENSFSVVQTDHALRGDDSDSPNLKEIKRVFQA